MQKEREPTGRRPYVPRKVRARRAVRLLLRAVLGLLLIALPICAYLGLAAWSEGSVSSLLEWEEISVEAELDGTEAEIGGGWEVWGITSISTHSGEEGFDPPRSPLFAYLTLHVLDMRRRRFQAWLPLWRLGIR